MKNFIFLVTLFLGTSAISANDELPIKLTSHEILTKGKVLASGISGNEPFSELKIVVHYLDEIFFCLTKLRVIHPVLITALWPTNRKWQLRLEVGNINA